MRKLILIVLVVAGGLSMAQDAQAIGGRGRHWCRHIRCPSAYVRSHPRQRAVYYDSGLAFERGRQYRPRRHTNYSRPRQGRIYYDSGLAFEY